MTEFSPISPLRVVIVGGGIASLETVLALHDLADGQLQVTVIAPEPDFVLRPLTVAGPFSRGHTNRLALAQVMDEHSGRFLRRAVLRVDADAHTVTLTRGDEVEYDVLVLAPGASTVPAFTHAVTFGAHPTALNGILADLEAGWSRSAAFVVPPGCTWPLPLYELALMTAESVWSMNMDHVDLHLVSPELGPLEIFGTEGSAAVAELLDAARVTTHFDVRPQIQRNGRVELGGGQAIDVDCIVALPHLEGPELRGIPSNVHGFIPVDDAGRVFGLDDVYAVGDATDRPIKQGGLACQQADVCAAHIAARAGAAVTVPPLQQVLRGRLLTGKRDRFLQREPGAADGTANDEPLWWPPEKVSGKYLSPYLVAKDVVHLSSRGTHPARGIDVHVPLTRQQQGINPESLELEPLSPMAI